MTPPPSAADFPGFQTVLQPSGISKLNIGAFNPRRADMWLLRAEVTFKCSSLTDDRRKAALVLDALPEDVWNLILPWTRSNSPTQYPALKEQLLQKYQPNPSDRAREILSLYNRPLMDDTPSHSFAAMQALMTLPATTSRDMKKLDLPLEILLSQLPAAVRAGLPDHTSTDTTTLLQKMDHMYSTYRHSTTMVAATSKDKEETVDPLKQEHHNPPQARPAARECYYHRRFGDRAIKCTSPCSWPSKNGQ